MKYAKGADIIHSVAMGVHSFAGQRAAEKLDICHFVQLIGGDVTGLDCSTSRSVFFLNWVKGVTGFIANSHSLANRLRELTNMNPSIKIIYRGVDPSVYYPRQVNQQNSITTDCQILYLGGYVHEQFDCRGDDSKGADMLLRAWQEVERAPHVNASLIVAGPHIDPEGFKKFQLALTRPDQGCVTGFVNSSMISRNCSGELIYMFYPAGKRECQMYFSKLWLVVCQLLQLMLVVYRKQFEPE